MKTTTTLHFNKNYKSETFETEIPTLVGELFYHKGVTCKVVNIESYTVDENKAIHIYLHVLD
jgi:3-methyladenine DNA glycosylase Mpg